MQKFPQPVEVGIHPYRRSLTSWSTHPAEQDSMLKAGWALAAEVPNFEQLPNEDTPRTAKLFVKGPYDVSENGSPPKPHIIPVEVEAEVAPTFDSPQENEDALTPERE